MTATDAARNFADLLDAIEHRHERYTIMRRGRAVAQLEPVSRGRGADLKALLGRVDALHVGPIGDHGHEREPGGKNAAFQGGVD